MNSPAGLTRRRFVAGTLIVAANAAGGDAVLAKCRYAAGPSLTRRMWDLPERTYFTYPHSNGFLDSETCVLARPTEGKRLEYLAYNLRTAANRKVCELEEPRMYYAIASNGAMAIPKNDGIILVDTRKGISRELIRWADWRVLSDCDISADGTKVLVNRFSLTQYNSDKTYDSRIDIVDTADGRITPVFRANFPLDHAHFSPFDPAWVCFCDGTVHSRQRMWVWHAELAPKARRVFYQYKSDGTSFEIGHERAMFNKRALQVIAYPASSATPRGLYEVTFDGVTRLISESNVDFHCNVSHDGRWAVVSTLSPVKSEPDALDVCERSPAYWIRSRTNYVVSDIMAVNVRSGERRLLVRASTAVTPKASVQPYEPQPAISPDGRWVLVKDAKRQTVIAIEIDQTALNEFLRT